MQGGVNILEKQGDHKSKTQSQKAKTKKQHNTRENYQTKRKEQKEKQNGRMKGSKKKYKVNGETRFKMAVKHICK